VVICLLGWSVLAFAGVAMAQEKTFTQDVAFLQKVTKAVVLESGDARIVVVPEYQGRVMTSTVGGKDDLSFGWLNYDLIQKGIDKTKKEHIYPFGGEDRFWLGPEGGQYAIFFKPGAKFVLDDWFTPPLLDTEPFEVARQAADRAVFTRDFEIQNYSGTKFKGSIQRIVRILNANAMNRSLGTPVPEGVRAVAYQTRNVLKNTGTEPWKKETGLLSIWILGMYKPSAKTTVVIPFKSGPESELGPKVNDAYFGKVPAEKLVVKDDILFFSGDGTLRSKIGISPKRSKAIAASYDAGRKVLTVVNYSQPTGEVAGYVNSMWEQQKKPYDGDVLNSYNDGPASPGAKPLGPFYELETSSPAAALNPGESIAHIQRTFHFQGDEAALDAIAVPLLGVKVSEIAKGLPQPPAGK
jgi:hypothetical protein